MASVSYNEAKAWAEDLENEWREAYEKTGKSAHPPFNHLVEVLYEDGTVLSFKNAWAVRYHVVEGDDDYLVVFAEHQGHHVIPIADLYDYQCWTQRERVPFYNEVDHEDH